MPRRLIAACVVMAVLQSGCAAHRLLFQPPVKTAEDTAAQPVPTEPANQTGADPNAGPAPVAPPPGPRPKWVQYDNWLDNHPAFKPVAYGAFVTGIATEYTVVAVAPFALLAGCVAAAGCSGGSVSGLSDLRPAPGWWPPPLPGQ
jgi:hypothetical protein